MAKILSFEVSEEFYQRLAVQQRKEKFNYLSPFLRALVEDSLRALEQAPRSEEGSNA